MTIDYMEGQSLSSQGRWPLGLGFIFVIQCFLGEHYLLCRIKLSFFSTLSNLTYDTITTVSVQPISTPTFSHTCKVIVNINMIIHSIPCIVQWQAMFELLCVAYSFHGHLLTSLAVFTHTFCPGQCWITFSSPSEQQSFPQLLMAMCFSAAL